MYELLFNGWGGANLSVRLFTQNLGIRPFLRIMKCLFFFFEKKRGKEKKKTVLPHKSVFIFWKLFLLFW